MLTVLESSLHLHVNGGKGKIGAHLHINSLLGDMLVHFHMDLQDNDFNSISCFEAQTEPMTGISTSSQISFLETKLHLFTEAWQIYHLLIIFATVLRMVTKFFEFFFNH